MKIRGTMLTWQAKYYQQCACRGKVNPNFIEYLSTSPNPWVCLLNKFCSIHFWWHVTRQSKLCGFWKGRYEEQHTPLIKDEPCNVWIPPKSDDVIYEEPLIWRYRRGFQLLKCSKASFVLWNYRMLIVKHSWIFKSQNIFQDHFPLWFFLE